MLSAIQRLIGERIRLTRQVLWPGLAAVAILAALASAAGWKPLATAIGHTSPPLLALALGVYAATWVCRTLRLHGLVRRAGHPLRPLLLFRIQIAAQALNSVLPARIGDVANVFFLHWQGLAFGRAAAVVVQSRVLDAGALAGVAALALGVLAVPGESVGWAMGGLLLCASFAVLPAALVWLDRNSPLMERLERGLLRRGTRLFTLTAQAGRDFLEAYHEIVRSAGLWVRTLAWSFLMALGEGLTAWIIARAAGVEIPLLAAVLTVALATIGKSATVTPGGLGVYEAVFLAVMLVFGVGVDLGLLVAILDHGLKKGFNLLIGLPALGGSALRGTGAAGTASDAAQSAG
ncbi:MAG: flippase-like domain-containing protein [Verrucomicrobia bacterium]|nr:flippase-like domain-containing protein [Verrucomicrobiota bacterium]